MRNHWKIDTPIFTTKEFLIGLGYTEIEFRESNSWVRAKNKAGHIIASNNDTKSREHFIKWSEEI